MRVGTAAALVLAALLATASFEMRPGDATLFPSEQGETERRIFVVSHGYHSGLVLALSDLLHEADLHDHPVTRDVLDRFRAFAHVEFGWGDEGFYHNVRTAADLEISEALRALFMPGNPSVIHVVGLTDGPRVVFPAADILPITLSQAGFARLAARLDQSFASDDHRHAEATGPGLYGPSLFFRANGSFSVFNVCNHWVARLLNAAGVPTNAFLATLPAGLFADLRWRAGLRQSARD